MLKATLVLICFISLSHADRVKTLISQSAYVGVEEADMRYYARIDTGALTSSLHALNIAIKGKKRLIYSTPYRVLRENPVFERIKNERFKQDIGSVVEFDTFNEKGEHKHICTKVVNVSQVNNAQGREYRYVVRLGLRYGDILKYKEVNLRDRSQMKHKLLIGRNWLKDDFLIDIGKDVQ